VDYKLKVSKMQLVGNIQPIEKMSDKSQTVFSKHPSGLGVDSLDPYSIATECFLRMSGVSHNHSPVSVISECSLQNGYKNFVGYKEIMKHVSETIDIDSNLDSKRKSEVEAYEAMLDHRLYAPIQYFTWKIDSNYQTVKPLFFGNFFSRLLFAPFVQKKIIGEVEKHEIYNKDEAVDRIKKCLHALHLLLGEDQNYFYGENPTSLDAIVYGFIVFLRDVEFPDCDAFKFVKTHQNLIDFADRIHKTYYIDFVAHVDLKLPVVQNLTSEESTTFPKNSIVTISVASISVIAYIAFKFYRNKV
jgi:hypothetical protein